MSNLEPEDKKKLEKYFGTKKFYIQFGLLIVGVIVVAFLFKKMKVEYVN
jgi:hypothetical protein